MRRRPLAASALALALLGAGVPWAGAQAPVETEVRIERVKPKKVKHPTLRFLQANRDFIRARYDRLRETPLEQRESGEIDPRFLAYQALLQSVFAADDSVASSEEQRRKREFLRSVTELGALESQLDQLERLLAGQRERLAALQSDFTGAQSTALAIVLSGDPGEAAPEAITLTLEDGTRLEFALSPDQRDALKRGGAVQVHHAMVEPRSQVLEIALRGPAWNANEPAFLTLEPTRDRLTLLRLDLSSLVPAQGVASLHATTWLHDSRVPNRDS